MMHGYGLVKKLCAELKDFMKMHNFTSIEDFRGYGVFECWIPCMSVFNILEEMPDLDLNYFVSPVLLLNTLQPTQIWYEGSKKQFGRGKPSRKGWSLTKTGQETAL